MLCHWPTSDYHLGAASNNQIARNVIVTSKFIPKTSRNTESVLYFSNIIHVSLQDGTKLALKTVTPGNSVFSMLGILDVLTVC